VIRRRKKAGEAAWKANHKNQRMQHWCEQYPKRYISKIYAQAESNAGDILIQKLFLAPRKDLAPNAYVLNLMFPLMRM